MQGLVNDGKSSRRRVKRSPVDGGTERKLRWGLGHDEDSASTRVPLLVSMRRRLSRSTNNLCCNRKSAPMMG